MSGVDSAGETSSVERDKISLPIEMDPIKSLTEQDVRGLIDKLASQAQTLTSARDQPDSSPYDKEKQDLERGRMQQLREVLKMLGQEKAVTQISIDYKI